MKNQPANHPMSRLYLIYGLSLLAAFSVYWGFAVMSAVAAGVTWVPIISFAASVFHFGISSWLFFIYSKIGKVFSIITATLMCFWPVAAIIFSFTEDFSFVNFIYLLPIGCTTAIVYSHLRTFNWRQPQPKLFTKSILILIPLGLFLYTSVYYSRLFI